jgi:carbonic anhydrase/acetyltransferase-like protein (isoleucine patch superfamily)
MRRPKAERPQWHFSRIEVLEDRTVLSAFHSPTPGNLPVLPGNAPAAQASFIDPTVRITDPGHIDIADKVYVGPFAGLLADGGKIRIGEGSDVQDNVLIATAGSGEVDLGDHAIIAHNANLFAWSGSPVHIGASGPNAKPSFVGFNSIIDGATVEQDAMVTHLDTIAPGITIHSGMKVLPGMYIRTQAEADNPALGKVTPVTAADREFMAGVLEVNEAFAKGYTDLFRRYGLKSVLGIGADPDTSFNPGVDRPTLNLYGRPQANFADPAFPDRIIGDVGLGQSEQGLRQVMGNYDSIRADEGDDVPTGHPHGFDIGAISQMGDHVTMHALEHTGIVTGNNVRYGYHSLVHGGEDTGNAPATDTTRIGDNVTIGDWAVVFRSNVGSGITIGDHAYIDGSQLYLKNGNIWANRSVAGLPDVRLFVGSVVPARAIVIDNVVVGQVEVASGVPGAQTQVALLRANIELVAAETPGTGDLRPQVVLLRANIALAGIANLSKGDIESLTRPLEKALVDLGRRPSEVRREVTKDLRQFTDAVDQLVRKNRLSREVGRQLHAWADDILDLLSGP